MEQLASEAMLKDELQHDRFEVCDSCGAVYSLDLLKPSSDFNDFHIRYCPYCGHNEF